MRFGGGGMTRIPKGQMEMMLRSKYFNLQCAINDDYCSFFAAARFCISTRNVLFFRHGALVLYVPYKGDLCIWFVRIKWYKFLLEELYTVAENYYFHLCPEIPSTEALNIHIAITLGKQHYISHAGFGQLQIYCG